METSMTADLRETDRKSMLHHVRNSGRIPAVVYGSGVEPRAISVDAHEFGRLYAQGKLNKLIQLDIADGTTVNVLIKEIQREALHQHPIHLDFITVTMNQPVDVRVGLHLTGEDRRIPDGGILETHLHEIEIACLPAAIPDRINLDISGLKIGQSLTVKDLTVPPGVTVRTHADEVVVSSVAPAKPAEAETPAAAAGETPAEGEKKVKEA